MTDSGAVTSAAVQQRRECRREEFDEQVRLAEQLPEYLDPANTFWTSLENRPLSPLSGIYQKRRGVKSGVPDVVVIQQKPGSVLIVFVELKSHRGVASKTQKQVRAEMLPAGVAWYMARSSRAAMMALYLAGVVFRRRWDPPPLAPWEGPFADPTLRLPQAPDVAARRREARQRSRERHRLRLCQQRTGEATQPATEPPHGELLQMRRT